MPKELRRPTVQSTQGSSHHRIQTALGIGSPRLIAKSSIKQDKEIAPYLTINGVTILTLAELQQYYAQLNEQISKLDDADFNGIIGRKLVAEVARAHKTLPKNNPTTDVTLTTPQETVVKTPSKFNFPVNANCGINIGAPAVALTSTNSAHNVDAPPSSSPRLKV